MRIDAHQHFWKYHESDYVWMGPEHEKIRTDFLPSDLEPLLDSIGFDGSVAVQARQIVDETAWLLRLAEEFPRVYGVVGWVDLCSREAANQIARFSDHPRMVGVRHVVHDEPDDEFILRADFQRGIRLLEPAGLAYDLLLFPRHIGPAIELADAFPNQRFVVDHIAKPPIATGEVHPWADDLREIAGRENVWCKLSGMVTEAREESWKPSDMTPYIDVVLEAFGAERVMIGSDWPVCTLAGEYAEVMDVALRYVERLSAAEQSAILGATCAQFYGIDAS